MRRGRFECEAVEIRGRSAASHRLPTVEATHAQGQRVRARVRVRVRVRVKHWESKATLELSP